MAKKEKNDSNRMSSRGGGRRRRAVLMKENLLFKGRALLPFGTVGEKIFFKRLSLEYRSL